ncbi:MAG: transcription termination/antitermination protein NusA [Bacteroidales bacterium]|nr:transcription termination/antitermination protein NusA [Candidatus Physcousia equi]
MATKKENEGVGLKEALGDFKQAMDIDRTTMMSVLEECFRSVIQKTYGTDENYDIIVNPDKGDLEIYRNRTVVPDGEVEDPNMEISLSDARKVEDDYEIGEEVTEQVKFSDFGRRSILTLSQTLKSRIMELQNDTLYNEFKDRVGEVISADVYQSWKRETLVQDDEGHDLILPRSEQIPSDFFRKGETVRAIIHSVDNTNGKPRIILSRTSPLFMQRMLEQEVPEVNDGLITIHKIVRIPGERAKIAVESYDERIDPVGACVGVKGSRVQGIVRELRGENIDVINYSNNTKVYIARALSPAEPENIEINEEEHTANVYLKPNQVSLAIGKGGTNIKLASMLTGYTIDVFRETQEEDTDDVLLDEFKNEIEPWIIDEIKKLGMETARQVLNASRDYLIQKSDLEEVTIDEVLSILAAEFE